MADTEVPDRYELVSSHVADHYPTDKFGVEQLIRLLLFQAVRLIERIDLFLKSLPSFLVARLPLGNQRIYRALDETSSRRYFLLATDRILRAPPVLL